MRGINMKPYVSVTTYGDYGPWISKLICPLPMGVIDNLVRADAFVVLESVNGGLLVIVRLRHCRLEEFFKHRRGNLRAGTAVKELERLPAAYVGQKIR